MVHNVYFWLKPDADHAKFEAGVRELFGIAGIQSSFLGRSAPTPERPVTDKSFSYHLSLGFASVEDHDHYQAHPDHHRFVEDCSDLWERVVVYDSREA